MKKSSMILCTALLGMGVFALGGCAKKAEETTTVAATSTTAQTTAAAETTQSQEVVKSDKIQVVSTIFSGYDWAREIVGENIEDYEITYLMDKGMDLHSFQPSAADISKIKAADLFIYVGGESDAWVDNVILEPTNEKQQVINLVQVLGDRALDEEIKEGMEDHEHEEGETHEHAEEEHDHAEEEHVHEGVVDEHVWLSLKNAQIFVQEIARALVYADPENADSLKENETLYMDELQTLDSAYQQMAENAKVKTVLFGDRFPFRYLVDDYGLDYYAAFVGCSTDTEASFETVTFLAKKVDELNLKNIFIIENSDGKLANTISDSTASKPKNIIVLDSLQSISKQDMDAGKSYLGVMTENLGVLQAALANE